LLCPPAHALALALSLSLVLHNSVRRARPYLGADVSLENNI